MVWRTCAPSWPRSTPGCARGLGKKDVVKDRGFCALELGPLVWLVDGQKVHVAGQRFSADKIRQVTRKRTTADFTTITVVGEKIKVDSISQLGIPALAKGVKYSTGTSFEPDCYSYNSANQIIDNERVGDTLTVSLHRNRNDTPPSQLCVSKGQAMCVFIETEAKK